MQICEPLESRRLFSGAQLDPSFGSGGTIADVLGQGNYRITTTAVQPGGRLLVGGFHTAVGKSGDIPFLLRFKADGMLDNRFAGNATVSQFSNARVGQIFIEPDGRIALDITANPANAGVYGLTVSGKLDPGIKRNVLARGVLAVDPQGRLLSGETDNGRITLRRFNIDGTADTTFGAGGTLQTDLGLPIQLGQQEHVLDLTGISVSEDGKIFLGGSYFVSQDPTTYRHAILVRVSSNGSLDSNFGDLGVQQFDERSTQDQFNSAIVGISATNDGGIYAIYRNADTTPDQVVNIDFLSTLTSTSAKAYSSNPKIFAEPGGGFLFSDGSYVSRFTASGRYNGTFGHVRIGGDSELRTLSTDGTLYSVSQTSTTDPKRVHTFTLHANRRFVDDGPAANLNVAELTFAPAGSYVFTVQYRDADGVLRSSLGNDDLRLVLPDGSTARVVFVKADATANANVINATYKIAPVGGSWSNADNGLYAVALNANAVSNIDGGISDPATLGYFRIDLA